MGGYLPFGEVSSDHRMLWIYIDFSDAFSYQMPPLEPPYAWRLKTENPACVKKFLTYYDTFIRDHGLHVTSFELQEEMLRQPMTPAMQRCYDNLRVLCIKGLQKVESKCRKLKMD